MFRTAWSTNSSLHAWTSKRLFLFLIFQLSMGDYFDTPNLYLQFTSGAENMYTTSHKLAVNRRKQEKNMGDSSRTMIGLSKLEYWELVLLRRTVSLSLFPEFVWKIYFRRARIGVSTCTMNGFKENETQENPRKICDLAMILFQPHLHSFSAPVNIPRSNAHVTSRRRRGTPPLCQSHFRIY